MKLKILILFLIFCAISFSQCKPGPDPFTGLFVACASVGNPIGPSGPTGPTGPTGATGPTGPTGATSTGVSVTNVTPVAVNANTTGDQTLQEVTITAVALNNLANAIKIHSSGIFTIGLAQTPTLTYKAKLCTVSGCGSGTARTLVSIVTGATIAATNNVWDMNLTMSATATGASGTVLVHGTLLVDLGATSAIAGTPYTDNNTASSSTIDLTGTLYLDITVATSAGSALNIFTSQLLSLMPQTAVGPTGPTGPTGPAAGEVITKACTIAYNNGSLTVAATSADVTCGSAIAANTKVTGMTIKHSASFTGGAITAVTASVGVSGSVVAYSGTALDVFQSTGTAGGKYLDSGGWGSYSMASHQPVVHFISTTANLNALTAGSLDVWISTVLLP